MIIEPGIDQRPNGKFRVRVSLDGKRVVKHFEALEAARAFRDALYRRMSTGKVVPVQGMSIIDLRSLFLERRKKLRNYVTDRRRFDSHLKTAPFAAKPVQTVSRREVLDWLDDLEVKSTAYTTNRPNKPLSRQTRKHCLNLLRSFFTFCQDRELVAMNPCQNVKVGGRPEPLPDGWYLTPEEQARVAAIPGAEKLMAVFAMGTGLRQGEQWNLRLVDLDLESVNPQVLVRFGSEGNAPKNGKVRVVPLFGMALEAARAWVAQLRTYAKKNPLGLVFPTPRGARRQKGKVPKVWAQVKAAVGRHVHWHLLRHTAASSLVAGWWGRRWRLEEVKEFMGHSSITVTQRYAHLATSRLLEVAGEASAQWSHLVPTAQEPAENPDAVRPSKPLVAGSSPAGRASQKQGAPTDADSPDRDQAGTSSCLTDYPCFGPDAPTGSVP